VQQFVDQAAYIVRQKRLFQERPLGLGKKALGGLAQRIAGDKGGAGRCQPSR
jgi:hypothetical protein